MLFNKFLKVYSIGCQLSSKTCYRPLPVHIIDHVVYGNNLNVNGHKRVDHAFVSRRSSVAECIFLFLAFILCN